MRTLAINISLVATIILLQSCGCGCKPPPPGALGFKIYYRSSIDADLLDPAHPNSFKEKDIKVFSTIETNGQQKNFGNETRIQIYRNEVSGKNSFVIDIPTPVNKRPIATYVQLSPSVMDTITYSFNGLNNKYPYHPEYIFYNKKIVWELSKLKPEEFLEITITK